MSIDIVVNATRAGIPVGGFANSGGGYMLRAFGGPLVLGASISPPVTIAVQLDLMNQQDARAYGGASADEGPYFRYNGYTLDYITLLQGDLLTDTVAIDPLTGLKKRYRIIGDPEFFIDNHWEFVADRMIGT